MIGCLSLALNGRRPPETSDHVRLLQHVKGFPLPILHCSFYMIKLKGLSALWPHGEITSLWN